MPNMDFLNGMWFAARAVTEAAGIFGPPGVAQDVFQFLTTKSTFYATRIDGVQLSAYATDNDNAIKQLLSDIGDTLTRILSDPRNGYLDPNDTFTVPDSWGGNSTFGTMGRDLAEQFGSGDLPHPSNLDDAP